MEWHNTVAWEWCGRCVRKWPNVALCAPGAGPIVAHPGVPFLPLLTAEYFLDIIYASMNWWRSAANVPLSLPKSTSSLPLFFPTLDSLSFPLPLRPLFISFKKVFLLPCLPRPLIMSPSHPFPSLTVSALLLWQWRWAGGDIRILAGHVLGHEHAPVCLGHGWDGCEKGEGWCRVQLLFWQVVILGGVALIQHPGPCVREGRCLGAASLLLG